MAYGARVELALGVAREWGLTSKRCHCLPRARFDFSVSVRAFIQGLSHAGRQLIGRVLFAGLGSPPLFHGLGDLGILLSDRVVGTLLDRVHHDGMQCRESFVPLFR